MSLHICGTRLLSLEPTHRILYKKHWSLDFLSFATNLLNGIGAKVASQRPRIQCNG